MGEVIKCQITFKHNMYVGSLVVGSRLLTIVLLTAPIIFAFISNPASFTMSWNEGGVDPVCTYLYRI